METYAAPIYVICDEILKALNVEDDQQAQMSNAEIMTIENIRRTAETPGRGFGSN